MPFRLGALYVFSIVFVLVGSLTRGRIEGRPFVPPYHLLVRRLYFGVCMVSLISCFSLCRPVPARVEAISQTSAKTHQYLFGAALGVPLGCWCFGALHEPCAAV